MLAIPREEVLLASAKEGTGVPEILEAIVSRIPPPRGDPAAPLQALIFDSHYDAYKGVVAYVRLAAGRLEAHAVDPPDGLAGGGRVARAGRLPAAGRARAEPVGRARWATSPPASRACATARWATR